MNQSGTAPLTLAMLEDVPAMEARLAARGISPSAAAEKAFLLGRTARALAVSGIDAGAAVQAFFVPGRIEVLGKHTDYAGGRSLLAASERGFLFAASPREDGRITMTDAASGERVEFSCENTPRSGHWSLYPMTVARRIARDFPPPHPGLDMAFASDLPSAAGMSSSTALITGTFLAISSREHLTGSPTYQENIDGKEALATYLGAIENGSSFAAFQGDQGVGTAGGSEDSTAMLCCEAESILQFSFLPTRLERTLPMPEGTVFVMASSGVAAEKTGTAMDLYNLASRLAAAAADALGSSDLATALAGEGGVPDRLREVLQRSRTPEFPPAALLDRFDHFHGESEHIIPAAADALAAGDLARFGTLAADSARIAETLLGNQVPETLHLARAATRLGALAACPFGAGFGGSVWALVMEADAQPFVSEWSADYRKAFPGRTPVFTTSGAGPAALEI